MISTHASRKRAKLKRKQKSESDRFVSIFPFHNWKPIPPLDQTMLHEWAKELCYTSPHSYSSAVDLISTSGIYQTSDCLSKVFYMGESNEARQVVPTVETRDKEQPQTPSIICFQCNGEMVLNDDIAVDNNDNLDYTKFYVCPHCD